MKVEKPDLDKQALIRLLQEAYALDAARLEFIPKGEESYRYLATTHTGRSYFVKIHLAALSPQLEASYRFVHQLYKDKGCKWVVSPHLTTTGDCLARLEKYAVAVFDYVVGVTKAPGELSGAQLVQFAGQLATLHGALPLALSSGLPKETYAIPFKPWLMEVLDAADQPLQADHVWAQSAHDLIRAEKTQILSVVTRVAEIGIHLQSADEPQSVTHGDLASHNIMQDELGNLLIFDWGKLSIAPAARDFVALYEDGNAALLAAYFRQDAGLPPLRFFKQTLTYYLYFSLLAMITDYGSWLILEEASQEEVDNAWAGLQ